MENFNEFWGDGDVLSLAVKYSGFFPFAGWLFAVAKKQAPLNFGMMIFTVVVCELVSLMYAAYRDHHRHIGMPWTCGILGFACFLGLNFFAASPAELASTDASVIFSLTFILLTCVFARIRTVVYQSHGGGSRGGGRHI